MAKQRRKQASARAYYRIAAKFNRAGNYGASKRYRELADRLVEEDRREQERKQARAEATARWQKKMDERKAR